MECCGDPFKIGAEVEWATWPLVDREWFVAILGDAEAARFTDVEDHHDEVNPPALQLVGVVRSIDAVFCEFAAKRPGGVLNPVEHSGAIVPLSSAEGYEKPLMVCGSSDMRWTLTSREYRQTPSPTDRVASQVAPNCRSALVEQC